MTQLHDTQREQLSAYLDKRLSIPETVAFEKQLAEDAELAAELRELQMVRSMLNDMPAVRPPRSFTLDPAVYAPKRASWSWMRWATVLGAFVLMLTVGLVLGNLNFGTQSSPDLAMHATKPEVVATQALAAQQSEPVTTFAPPPQANAMVTEQALPSGTMATAVSTRDRGPVGMAQPTQVALPTRPPAQPAPVQATMVAPAATMNVEPTSGATMEFSSATEIALRELEATASIADLSAVSPIEAPSNSDLAGSNEAATNVTADRLEDQSTAIPTEPEQNDNKPKQTPSTSATWLWLIGLLGIVAVIGAIVVLRNRRNNYE